MGFASRAGSTRFYSELVVVTVMSYVAASSWRIVLSEILDRYAPSSLVADLLVAVITTLIAILVLSQMFPHRRRRTPDEQETDSPDDEPRTARSYFLSRLAKEPLR